MAVLKLLLFKVVIILFDYLYLKENNLEDIVLDRFRFLVLDQHNNIIIYIAVKYKYRILIYILIL